MRLISSDGVEVEVVDISAFKHASQLYANIIEDIGEDCYDNVIPIPNVTGTTLSKVLEFVNHFYSNIEDETDVDDINSSVISKMSKNRTRIIQFMDIPLTNIFELISAANYFHIQPLLDILCKQVADMIRNKSPEEIRKIFNIVNDFTPEEEAEVMRENAWAFDCDQYT